MVIATANPMIRGWRAVAGIEADISNAGVTNRAAHLLRPNHAATGIVQARAERYANRSLKKEKAAATGRSFAPEGSGLRKKPTTPTSPVATTITKIARKSPISARRTARMTRRWLLYTRSSFAEDRA